MALGTGQAPRSCHRRRVARDRVFSSGPRSSPSSRPTSSSRCIRWRSRPSAGSRWSRGSTTSATLRVPTLGGRRARGVLVDRCRRRCGDVGSPLAAALRRPAPRTRGSSRAARSAWPARRPRGTRSAGWSRAHKRDRSGKSRSGRRRRERRIWRIWRGDLDGHRERHVGCGQRSARRPRFSLRLRAGQRSTRVALGAGSWMGITVVLGVALGLVAAALLGRHLRVREAWSVLLGVSLLAIGLAVARRVVRDDGRLLRRARARRRVAAPRASLRHMSEVTERIALLPVLLLAGVMLEWLPPRPRLLALLTLLGRFGRSSRAPRSTACSSPFFSRSSWPQSAEERAAPHALLRLDRRPVGVHAALGVRAGLSGGRSGPTSSSSSPSWSSSARPPDRTHCGSFSAASGEIEPVVTGEPTKTSRASFTAPVAP